MIEITHDVVLHNDDTISFDYAMVVLTKIFDQSKEQARKTAEEIDQKGLAVVFSGSKDEVNVKLSLLDVYNEINGKALKAEAVATGTAPEPIVETYVTTGPSVTVALNNYQLDRDGMIYLLKNIAPKGIEHSTLFQWGKDLNQGREVVIVDFGNDPKGDIKAEALLNILVGKVGLEDTHDLGLGNNITFSVRPAQYTPATNSSLEDWREKEKSEAMDLIGGFGNQVMDMYIKHIEKEYGTVDNFLATAPQDKLDEYQEIMGSMDELNSLTKTKKPKA